MSELLASVPGPGKKGTRSTGWDLKDPTGEKRSQRCAALCCVEINLGLNGHSLGFSIKESSLFTELISQVGICVVVTGWLQTHAHPARSIIQQSEAPRTSWCGAALTPLSHGQTARGADRCAERALSSPQLPGDTSAWLIPSQRHFCPLGGAALSLEIEGKAALRPCGTHHANSA